MRIVLLLCLLLLASYHSRAGVVQSTVGKLYVLSIGFSPAATEKTGSYTSYMPCDICLSDAKGMAAYFEQLNKRRRIASEVITYTYTAGITTDTLNAIFNRLQLLLQPQDVLVFYYASSSWGIRQDENNNPEGLYVLSAEKAGNDYQGFTLRQLKMFTDRIAAKKQLIIFDTGNGDVIQPDYYRNFFSDNVSEALFSRKNRVIFCPEKYSSETYDPVTKTVKGDMYKAISSLPDTFNVMNVFDTGVSRNGNAYKQFMRNLYANQLGLLTHITILKEVDYLKMLSAIKIQGDGKRGFSLPNKPVAIDSSFTQRKKKAVIIATSQYGAPIWQTLTNPVNDGAAAEQLFKKMGYEVVALYNQPKDEILNALSEVTGSEVKNPYDQFIIYFAGHGYYDPRQKAGYIVCADSKNLKDPFKPTMTELGSYIDYTVLFRNLNELNKVVLITDVCFGGTSVNSMLQASKEADPSGERNKQLNPFKKVLASGIREVDDFIRYQDGSISRHSPFAAALMNVLGRASKPLSFEEVYAQLKSDASLNPTPIEASFGLEKIPNTFVF